MALNDLLAVFLGRYQLSERFSSWVKFLGMGKSLLMGKGQQWE